MNVFDLIHDLQLLRAKSEMVPLDHAEAARLEGLSRVLAPSDDEEPTFVRLLRPMPALMARLGYGFVAVQVRQLSGDAVWIAPETVVPLGDLVVVHIDSPVGVAYSFPCRVHAVHEYGSELRFDGFPSRHTGNAVA